MSIAQSCGGVETLDLVLPNEVEPSCRERLAVFERAKRPVGRNHSEKLNVLQVLQESAWGTVALLSKAFWIYTTTCYVTGEGFDDRSFS